MYDSKRRTYVLHQNVRNDYVILYVILYVICLGIASRNLSLVSPRYVVTAISQRPVWKSMFYPDSHTRRLLEMTVGAKFPLPFPSFPLPALPTPPCPSSSPLVPSLFPLSPPSPIPFPSCLFLFPFPCPYLCPLNVTTDRFDVRRCFTICRLTIGCESGRSDTTN